MVLVCVVSSLLLLLLLLMTLLQVLLDVQVGERLGRLVLGLYGNVVPKTVSGPHSKCASPVQLVRDAAVYVLELAGQ